MEYCSCLTNHNTTNSIPNQPLSLSLLLYPFHHFTLLLLSFLFHSFFFYPCIHFFAIACRSLVEIQTKTCFHFFPFSFSPHCMTSLTDQYAPIITTVQHPSYWLVMNFLKPFNPLTTKHQKIGKKSGP